MKERMKERKKKKERKNGRKKEREKEKRRKQEIYSISLNFCAKKLKALAGYGLFLKYRCFLLSGKFQDLGKQNI